MGRTPAAALAVLFGTVLIVPAAAQFGSIFGSPPRPPSDVPGGRQEIPPPPNYPPPGDYPPQANYPPPQGNYPPPPPQGNYPPRGNYPPQANYPPPDNYPPPGSYPPPGNAPGPYDGGVQSRPLPPPGQPGQPGEPAVGDPALRDPAPRAPVARQPRGGPQPGDTSPQAGDEVITEPPSQRITNTGALFTGLDKITGRIINFDVAIGETVQFGALQLTPRACYTRPPTETANTDAFVEVDEVTLQGEVRRIFTGWVFAASPGLHAVEHPIYDLWLTDCKGPLVTAERPPEPAPAAAPPPRREQRPPQQKQARPPTQQQQRQQPGNLPPFR